MYAILCVLGDYRTCVSDPGYCAVKLGMMGGRLQTGVNTLQGFKEDKRNRITPGNSHTHTYSLHFFVCVSLCLSIYLSLLPCIFLSLSVFFFVCPSLCLSLSFSLSILDIFLCLCFSLSFFIFLCLSISLPVSVPLSLSVYRLSYFVSFMMSVSLSIQVSFCLSRLSYFGSVYPSLILILSLSLQSSVLKTVIRIKVQVFKY